MVLHAAPIAWGTQDFSEGFEGAREKNAEWAMEGDTRIAAEDAFEGKQVLVLSKGENSLRTTTLAKGPEMVVSPGIVEVAFATRSDLTSMDNSYNGTLSLEFFDEKKVSLGATELGAWFRQSPWKKENVEVAIPDGATSARFVASLNKETPGKFWVDALGMTAKGAADTGGDGLRRMVLRFPDLGHLLYPESPRIATVEVWSAKELPEGQREARFVVRDYWGAEQAKAIAENLVPTGKVPGKNYFRYEAKVDLSAVPLRVGKYYELQGKIPRSEGEPFSNFTSFAILPEAVANGYAPEEIPFTSRTWDQRFREGPLLTHRLGIRISNVWGRMYADPARLEAPQIELVHELGMGVLTSSPAQQIEARADNWRELLADDGALLRKGVRAFFDKYGKYKPIVVNLGNEPHNKGAEVQHDVEAYRVIYEEIKKIDPSIFVVGTSVGLEEAYFKAGFGKWLDAYDFHSYEDPESVRTILSEKYPEMFRKYGFAKPIWSTEIGMNSQGMTRQAVASLVYRKFANFFAGGGANVSWFGLFYPDPDARIHNSFASAHNIFDCRYSQYAPKLDAIAYYNSVNAIAIKKYTGDRTYGDKHLFLFRDRDDQALIIAYKDKGREESFLPLPGVGKVEMIQLDGSRDTVDASGKGLSLTISEDPVLLLFEKGPKTLPENLALPKARFSGLPSEFIREGKNRVEVSTDGLAPEDIELLAPPFWQVTKVPAQSMIAFEVTPPADSAIREADLTLRVSENDKITGLLKARRPVAGILDAEILPIAAGENEGPGLRLVLNNNSVRAERLTWNVQITGQQILQDGAFSEVSASQAKIGGESSGTVELGAAKTTEIRLPIFHVQPLTVYHVKAAVRTASGYTVSAERPVAGFVGVPRASEKIVVDGALEESAWRNAPVHKLDDASAFFGFALSGRPAPTWDGKEDLSAEIRYLWDDENLYVAVNVKDDVAGEVAFEDADLWRQDGLQFLIDPARRAKEKPGKYEYSVGLGKKGPQTWCTLSADAGAPTGDARDVQTAIRRGTPGTGNVTYEVAIPWKRLVPFSPAAGGNLGFTMIVNEDDGKGRDAFLTWFGNAHTKDVDTVGDLILLP